MPAPHRRTASRPRPAGAAAVPPVPRAPDAVQRSRVVVRDAGLLTHERALRRLGFADVAGVDEAGRGACAGPLVVAAAVLPDGRRGEVPGLADSKLLTPAAREAAYTEVVRRAAAYSVVVVPAAEVDRCGLHVCNVAGMRRAVAALGVAPAYVLTDGFPVRGLGVPALAVWKGDRVSACVAAASVLAKVTRDRILVDLHAQWPAYGFDGHKGYTTPEHSAALEEHGPCPEHRRSYVNVRRAAAALPVGAGRPVSTVPAMREDDAMRHPDPHGDDVVTELVEVPA